MKWTDDQRLMVIAYRRRGLSNAAIAMRMTEQLGVTVTTNAIGGLAFRNHPVGDPPVDFTNNERRLDALIWKGMHKRQQALQKCTVAIPETALTVLNDGGS
jgi:hypothetical protein